MSQTNTDYLFQVIAPVADRGSSTPRYLDDGSGFGDHLSQASASVSDFARPPSRSETSSVNSTSDSSTTNSYAPCASGPSDESNESATFDNDRSSTSSQTSAQDKPTEQACDESAAACDDEQHHDADKPDDEDAAAIANAALATGNLASQKTETLKHETDSDSAKPVETNTSLDEATHRAAKQAAKTDGLSTKLDSQAEEANTTLVAAAEAEHEVAETPADGAGAVKPEVEGAATGKQAKHDEHAGAAHAAADANGLIQDDTQAGKQQTASEENAAQTADTSERTAAETPANPKAASAKSSTSSSDSDESSDDKPRRGSKTTARANSQNDAVAPVNKSSITAAASGLVANLPDVAATNEATSDVSDAAAKPVAAKVDAAALSPGRATRPNAEINGGSRAASANETPRVDPARFVGRVAKAFQTAHERGGTLQLRLSPPELGAMRLELTVKDGVMTAALETDNANARRVLLDHLPALRDRLAEQNIRVDRFDVDVRQENNGGQANPKGPHQQPHQQQQSENSGARRTAAAQQREREDAPLDIQPAASRISSTGINLIV